MFMQKSEADLMQNKAKSNLKKSQKYLKEPR